MNTRAKEIAKETAPPKHPLVIIDEALTGAIPSVTKRKAFINALADLVGSRIDIDDGEKTSLEVDT